MLVFGHGYTAAALSRRLLATGWKVIGTTRSAGRLAELKALGVRGVIWPGSDLTAALRSSSHILVSLAPGAQGDPALGWLRGRIVGDGGLKWLGYLSTTAVYGDHAGGWVDETTPVAPTTERGIWRANAEAAWIEFAASAGVPLHIFRLAGIYGPGRGPLAKVRAGTANRIIKKGQVFNRIHVDDIAEVVVASIADPNPMRIYNVCDDEAAAPQDVIGLAAELLGLPQPEAVEFAAADMSDMARSFYAESKRIRNDRIKTELGVTLRYPSYREGLPALLAAKM